jgi:hypothetical protein
MKAPQEILEVWRRFDGFPMETLRSAAEYSQRLIKTSPLVEMRIPFGGEISHWEFYRWKSYLSTLEGLHHDSDAGSVAAWAERIHEKTGIDPSVAAEALIVYQNRRNPAATESPR